MRLVAEFFFIEKFLMHFSDFHGLEMEVLVKSLKTLELNRKAELMGDEGVKFF